MQVLQFYIIGLAMHCLSNYFSRLFLNLWRRCHSGQSATTELGPSCQQNVAYIVKSEAVGIDESLGDTKSLNDTLSGVHVYDALRITTDK